MTQLLDIEVAGEGSLRLALASSAAAGRPIAVRRRSGFPENHLALARALSAALSGELTFEASRPERLRFAPPADDTIPSAAPIRLPGDVPLVPVVLTAVAALGVRGVARELSFEGSTHAPESASFEVASSCFLPILRRIGVRAEIELDTAGFLPRGGGLLNVRVAERLDPLTGLELAAKDELRSIGIVSTAPAAIPAHVQQRQAARARSGVAVAGVPTHVQLVKLRSRKAGSAVAITGLFGELPVTVSAVSRRGGSVESVGAEAAAEFRRAVSQTSVLPPLLLEPLLLGLAFAPARSVLSTWRLPVEIEAFAAIVRELTHREVGIHGKAGREGRVVIELADRRAGAPY